MGWWFAFYRSPLATYESRNEGHTLRPFLHFSNDDKIGGGALLSAAAGMIDLIWRVALHAVGVAVGRVDATGGRTRTDAAVRDAALFRHGRTKRFFGRAFYEAELRDRRQ